MGISREEKIKERIQKFRPIDDTFFEVMIKDIEACEEILRVILEDRELKIVRLQAQHSVKNLYGRSVRLDAFCILGNGTYCNIEVQRSNNDDHLRRVRYNASCTTANITDPGKDFRDVPTVYVIYISEFDFLKQERTIYHIDKVIQETGEIIDDGLHEIFVNTKINDGTDIAELMQCFTMTEVNNPKFPKMSNRVSFLKNDEEGIKIMCKVMEEYAKEYAEEYAKEYAEEAVQETVISLIKEGDISEERGAEKLNISIDKMRELLKKE